MDVSDCFSPFCALEFVLLFLTFSVGLAGVLSLGCTVIGTLLTVSMNNSRAPRASSPGTEPFGVDFGYGDQVSGNEDSGYFTESESEVDDGDLIMLAMATRKAKAAPPKLCTKLTLGSHRNYMSSAASLPSLAFSNTDNDDCDENETEDEDSFHTGSITEDDSPDFVDVNPAACADVDEDAVDADFVLL